MLALSRQTVNQQLQVMAAAGLLRLRRGVVEITDQPGLQLLAEQTGETRAIRQGRISRSPDDNCHQVRVRWPFLLCRRLFSHARRDFFVRHASTCHQRQQQPARPVPARLRIRQTHSDRRVRYCRPLHRPLWRPDVDSASGRGCLAAGSGIYEWLLEQQTLPSSRHSHRPDLQPA
jgi:hypothetical protein